MIIQHRDIRQQDTSNAATPALQITKQNTASLVGNRLAMKARWRTVLGAARATWHRISGVELAMVEGNINTLAGLVQLRTDVSREESDSQVKAFFATYLPTDTSPTQSV